MSFVSPEFSVLFLTFLPLYWGLYRNKVAQLGLLTLSSLALYATWTWTAVLLLIGFGTYIWLAGLWLNSGSQKNRSNLLLQISILLGLVLLITAKYYEFARQTILLLLPHVGLNQLIPVIDFVAPVGISFYTFQAITYLVWRFESPPERVSFHRTLLFLSFWPTLFAGPILRAKDFFRQIELEQMGRPIHCERAIFLILLGLTQKLVFSNWLSETFVSDAFNYPGEQTFISSCSAIWGYSLQIFFDFAGYTSLMTGLALLLGYELPINFRQPYLARDLRDFWTRWHISLSTFIRDYVYIPLGGNRHGFLLTQKNVLIAMIVSGIWHGANSTFALWGLLHGIGIVVLNIYQRLVPLRMPSIVGQIVTLVYVGLAWTFFRANSADEALAILSGLTLFDIEVDTRHAWLLLLTLVFFVLSTKARAIESGCIALMSRYRGWATTVFVTLSAYFIILLGPTGIPGFIYYRF